MDAVSDKEGYLTYAWVETMITQDRDGVRRRTPFSLSYYASSADASTKVTNTDLGAYRPDPVDLMMWDKKYEARLFFQERYIQGEKFLLLQKVIVLTSNGWVTFCRTN